MTQEAILDKENFIREMKQNLKDRKEGKNTVMKNSLNINTKEKKKYFYPKETSNFNKAILNSKLSSNKFISKQISIENLISDQNKDKNRSDYSQNKDKRGLIYNNEVDEYTNNYEHGKKITLNNYNSDSYVNWIGKEEKNAIKINGRNAKVLTDNLCPIIDLFALYLPSYIQRIIVLSLDPDNKDPFLSSNKQLTSPV